YVGEKGMPAVIVFGPEGKASLRQGARLVQTKGVKLVGEIAGRKLGAVCRVRREDAPKAQGDRASQQQEQEPISRAERAAGAGRFERRGALAGRRIERACRFNVRRVSLCGE